MIRRNPAQTWPQTRAFLSLTGSHFTETGARYDGKIVISSFVQPQRAGNRPRRMILFFHDVDGVVSAFLQF